MSQSKRIRPSFGLLLWVFPGMCRRERARQYEHIEKSAGPDQARVRQEAPTAALQSEPFSAREGGVLVGGTVPADGSNLNVSLCPAENICTFLCDRSRDPESPHFRQKRGSLQSQFGRGTAWSTYDPAGLLKRLHHQSAI